MSAARRRHCSSRDLRADRRTFAKLLEIVDNDQRSAGKTAFDNPVVAVLRTECHVIHVNRVVRGDGIDLLLALKFCDRCLRNKNRVVKNLGLGLHPAKLPGTKNVSRIRERSSDANRAGLRIQLPIDKNDVPFLRIDFAIRQRESQRNLRRAMKQVAAARARPFRQCEILAVADGKIDLDRIELRNRSQYGLGADEISDLRRGLARNAGNQRANLGKPKIQVRRRNRGLCSLYGSFRLRLLLDLVVELASGNRVSFRQRRVAVHVDLGESELRLRLAKLTLRLFKRRFKRARIDLEQDLPLLNL